MLRSTATLAVLAGCSGCIDRSAPLENRAHPDDKNTPGVASSRSGFASPKAPHLPREDSIAPASELRFLRRVPANGPPSAFTLHPDMSVTPDVFMEKYAGSLWNLSRLDELRLLRSLPEGNGYVNNYYQQFHAGYRVLDGKIDLTIHSNGEVVSGVGKPVGDLERIPTVVRVLEPSAIDQARRRALSACSLSAPVTFSDTPRPVLLISEPYRRLMWQVSVTVSQPRWAEWNVRIDADTGELLHEWGGFGLNGENPGCTATS
jgi:hypothetical protein